MAKVRRFRDMNPEERRRLGSGIPPYPIQLDEFDRKFILPILDKHPKKEREQ